MDASDVDTTPTRWIHQWSGPRSMSTAAMYSWHARADCVCFDEPFHGHYLASNPHMDRPYRDAVLIAGPVDLDGVVARFMAGEQPGSAPQGVLTFCKHIAKQLDAVDLKPWACSPGAAHVILIRCPRRMLISLATTTDWFAEPTLDGLALLQLVRAHAKLCRLLPADRPPVVVDADDLVADPEGTLRALCAALRVPFSPTMLAWPPGPKPCDGPWAAEWYQSVHRSRGWSREATSRPEATLPRHLEPVLQAAMPLHEQLRANAIRPLGGRAAPGGAQRSARAVGEMPRAEVTAV